MQTRNKAASRLVDLSVGTRGTGAVNLASSGTDEAAGSSLPRDEAPANYFRDPSKAMVNLSSSMPSTLPSPVMMHRITE